MDFGCFERFLVAKNKANQSQFIVQRDEFGVLRKGD